MKAALLLLPNLLGDHKYVDPFLPASVGRAVATLDGLIAESEREGRRYLGRFETKKKAEEIPIALFNEHTKQEDIDFFLEPILLGERWGFVSDAGLPCIADPGSALVLRAKQKGINVQAFVGPSSLFLALMLSGLPAQKFTFQGYLNAQPEKRRQEIKQLAAESEKKGITQVIIETPYRNEYMLADLIDLLPEKALLCVAWDLTLPTQGVVTKTKEEWKKSTPPNLDKKPAIFLFSL